MPPKTFFNYFLKKKSKLSSFLLALYSYKLFNIKND